MPTVHSSRITDHAVFDDRYLRKVAMDVQPDVPNHRLTSHQLEERGTAGQSTPTDSRSRRIRTSRKGGHLLTRARGPSCKHGLPIPIPHRCPCPGRSHRTTTRPTRATGQPDEQCGAPTHFHTRYQKHREPQCPHPQGGERARALPDRAGRPQVRLPGDHEPRPHRQGPTALDHPMEGTAQRVRTRLPRTTRPGTKVTTRQPVTPLT